MSKRLTHAQLASITGAASGRSRGGARAASSGKEFENALESMHDAYKLRGLAAIDKLNMPTVPAYTPGHKGPPLRRVVGSSGVDYWGTVNLPAGGRHSIVIEAKTTQEAAASLPIADKAGIHHDQLCYLNNLVERFGVWGVVLWRSAGQIGILTPDQVIALWIRVSQLGEKRVERGRFVWMRKHDDDYLGFALEHKLLA